MGEERDEVNTPVWTWDPINREGYLSLEEDSPHASHPSPELDFSNCTLLMDLDEDGNLLGIEVLK